ncbi:hypothetical protein AB6A40_009261 [Gnathostoma spinigerum]|uniref:Suppressor of forked domain-containing protein n=1 Tax=Gnathostoma spinigerum TaxID=75299 RepID=A0ABD6F0G4_9BILA
MDNGDDVVESMEDVHDEHYWRNLIEENPFDGYARHSLIGLLRKSASSICQQERVTSSDACLMPAEFWLDWIEDEINAGKDSKDIVDLFDRALVDYKRPEIYRRYIKWACEASTELGTAVLEKTCEAIGLRVDTAAEIWSLYIDFEKGKMNSSDTDESKKRAAVGKLYERFLKIPHLGMENSWDDYEDFIGMESSAQNEKSTPLVGGDS